jgi:serine/threonine protein kinase
MMEQQRWERIKDLFDRALAVSPQLRASFVVETCGDDLELRSEVESLLDHEGRAGSFLQGSPSLAFGSAIKSSGIQFAFALGQVVGARFQISRFIGRGGMGEVYEAKDLKLGTPVALKTLRPEISAHSWALKRFRQEIHLARRISHPNVCHMFEIARDSAQGPPDSHATDRVFITMELLQGESLSEFLKRRKRVNLDEARPLIRQMADALHAAHEAGVIHRDFKPSNVVLADTNADSVQEVRVVVTDFGLAHAVTGSIAAGESFAQSLSKTGQILGTLAYMAPEQLEGKEATPATDVYALGLVIYEMLTGHTPFPEDAPLAGAFLRVKDPPPSPRMYVPELDHACEEAIMKCLRIDPSARFQSARDASASVLAPAGTATSSAPSLVEVRSSSRVTRRTWVGLASLFLVLILATTAWRAAVHRRTIPLGPTEVVPLLSMQGNQVSPAFSPDGKKIAFAVRHRHPGIYSLPLDSVNSLQLTHSLASSPDLGDCCPTWSPDGRQIAFIREESETERSFWVVPASGGSPQRVFADTGTFLFNYNRLDWSPDGQTWAFSEFSDPNRAYQSSKIVLLSLKDLTKRQLTAAPDQHGDREPAFSPDGSQVAFIRWPISGNFGDVFVVPVLGGVPRQLTFDNSCTTPAWTPDGEEIVFSSTRGGLRTLWRVPVSGGPAKPISGVGEMAMNPALARKGNQLAYLHYALRNSIWEIGLTDDKHASASPTRRFSSRGINWRPSFSPDGHKVVFESDRLGSSDIWYCARDGSNCKQLTSLHATSGTARWSPDGRYVAFESQSESYYNIYVVELPDGKPRLISPFPKASTGAPNWSRDGQWIYFYSTEDRGHFQLWKVPVKGGAPVQVTKKGGVYGTESEDGRFLYYSKFEEPGIWKMPLSGGEEVKVLDQPPGWAWFNWVLTPRGIYFLDLMAPPNGRIEFFDVATRRTVPIFSLQNTAPGYAGLAISPDRKAILYGQTDLADSYIMLVKNFR